MKNRTFDVGGSDEKLQSAILIGEHALLRAFLRAHAATMPRTALRYAIERLPPAERKTWLAATANKT